MKKIIVALSILTFIIGCNTKNNSTEETNSDFEKIAIEGIPELSIAEFDERAGEFVNTEVQVKGIVDHVCKHGGKKILLVNEDGEIHITSEERFPEELVGEEIYVNGLVEEFRVDEAYCIQMDEDNIKSHKEGDSDSELFEKKKHSIQAYRDSMKVAGVDHLSYYSMVFISYKLIESEVLGEGLIDN